MNVCEKNVKVANTNGRAGKYIKV